MEITTEKYGLQQNNTIGLSLIHKQAFNLNPLNGNVVRRDDIIKNGYVLILITFLHKSLYAL